MRLFYVYILTNKKDGTLYIGITNNIDRRLFEHRSGKGSKFIKKYNLHKLVHLEKYTEALKAISREKQLKIGIGNGK